MKRFLAIVTLGTAMAASAGAADADGAEWRAQWIGTPGATGTNLWLCFRKSFDAAAAPATATARIACDSKYWLWVNGRMVVFEGQLKRGPTPQDTYFDTVDLKPHLKAGSNTVAVLVWYWGRHGFAHNDSGKAGLVFDAAIDGKPLLSDATWKTIRHPAFGSTDAPHPNFRLAEPNIRFDARKDPGSWQADGFDDSAWAAADEFGKPPAAPWNRLVERPIPFWRNPGLTDYRSVVPTAKPDGSVVVVAALPYNAQVTPWLKVEAPAGLTIDIRTDNYMGGGPPNVRAEYVTRDGVQEYESPGWMNGHDVRYTLPAGVKLIGVRYRETGYDAGWTGRFRCEDEALNTLWEKSRRTLYITMRDNYMDCPDRERAQWWGDAVNEMGEAFYVFDAVRGPLLARKGFLELARWQRPDKTLFSPVPAGVPRTYPEGAKPRSEDGSWSKELPMQMLATVGWYGAWTYYRYTGDQALIADIYPAVRDYMSLWKLGPDGLVVHRKGDWDWPDWGENHDVPILDSCWVHLALRAAVEMARLTGNDGDIAGYEERMKTIEKGFNAVFWRGDRYHSPSYKGQTDDRANAMAVVAGLAKPEFYPAIRQVLRTQEYASPYMEKYVLEALCLMDAPGEAIARAKKRWAAQIESPLTTLWEGWGIGSKGYGGGTYNHAWSGGALTMLHEYIAGLAPTAPGWTTFRVCPQPGPLKKIDTTVSTPRGTIDLSIRIDDAKTSLALAVPAGTTATVCVPATEAGDYARITVDGKTAWTPAGPAADSPARYLDKTPKGHRFELAAGRHTIEGSR